jgi:small basic protein
MQLTHSARNFFVPNERVMVIFIPFSLLAAGFFSSPATFVPILLPIGGLWYYVLSYLVAALQPITGTVIAGFGDHFLTLLAVTGLCYLYVLACYISYVSKRNHDRVRLAMIFSLLGIFAYPVAMTFAIPYFVQQPPIPPVKVSYLDKQTCNDIASAGSSSWDPMAKMCTVGGGIRTDQESILGISEGTVLKLTGPSAKLENFGGNGILNNGTIFVDGGATLINAVDKMDPERSAGVIINRGSIVIRENSTFSNQGRIDGVMNAGRLVVDGTFENGGEVFDSSRIEIRGELVNRGIISNYDERAQILNHGSIINLGSISNAGGAFQNYGSVENYGRLSTGTLHNYSSIDSTVGTISAERIYSYCAATSELGDTDAELIDSCLV